MSTEEQMVVDWPHDGADELAEQIGNHFELLCDPITNRCALASRQDVEWYEQEIEMGELTFREFGTKAREKCGEQVNVLARMENDDEGRLGFLLVIYSGKSEVGRGFDLEDLGKAAREALDLVGKPDPFVKIKR